ncbi:MAG: hypothetical protein U0264_13950 [Candidatus Kapaibacterium sp.]
MKTTLSLLLACLFTFGMLSAAPVDSTTIMHHSIGISGSSITGFGVAYRYNFDNQWYAKTVGALYYTEDSDSRSDFYSFIGLELQRNFIQTPSTRLYGFAGTSYWYNMSESSYTSAGVTTVYTSKEHTMNIGAGVGFELSIWEHFGVNFDFGFQYAGIQHPSTTTTESSLRSSSRSGMGGGIGFGYQF